MTDRESQQDSPICPVPSADRLPSELLECRAWILWRAEWASRSDDTRKIAKIPCDGDGKNASYHDGHLDYGTALGRVQALRERHGPHYGLGIAMSGTTGIVIVDLDGDLAGGTPSERLRWIAGNHPTWAERSVSGTGVHLVYRGQIAGKKNIDWRGGTVEVFGSTGFIAITGDCTDPVPPVVADGSALLTEILAATSKGEKRDQHQHQQQQHHHDTRPGDDYDLRGSWQAILEPHGWTLTSGTWEHGRLTRPGKDGGVSASTESKGSKGESLLRVFSNNAPPLQPEVTYGKFRAFATLNHKGNLSEAAAELRRQGYGGGGSSGGTGGGQQHVSTTSGSTSSTATEYLEFVSLAGIKAKPVKWLVPGRIPQGKVTLIAADGGSGKSTLVRSMAAHLTRGHRALGGNYDNPASGDVLLLAAEDDYAEVVVPHLIAEGADLNRFSTVHHIKTDPTGETFTRHLNLDHILLLRDELIRRPSIRIVVIDPIISLVSSAKLNANHAEEVRQILDPLHYLAEQTGVAIIVIAHLNKAPSPKAAARIAGSAQWLAGVRLAYMVGTDPEDPNQRLLMPVKKNLLGIEEKAAVFRLQRLESWEADVYRDHPALIELSDEDYAEVTRQMARVMYGAPISVSADEVFAAKPQEGSEAIQTWLKERLGTEVAWPDDMIKAEAEAAGYSFGQYKRAKTALKSEGLRVSPGGFGEGWVVGFGNVRTMPRAPVGQSEGGGVPHGQTVQTEQTEQTVQTGDLPPPPSQSEQSEQSEQCEQCVQSEHRTRPKKPAKNSKRKKVKS